MTLEKSEEKQYKQPSIFSTNLSPEQNKKIQSEKVLAVRFEQLLAEVEPLQGVFRPAKEKSKLKGLKQLALEGKITQGEYRQNLKSFESRQERQLQAIEKFKTMIRDLQKSGYELKPQVIKNYIGNLTREYGLNFSQKERLYVNLGVAGR